MGLGSSIIVMFDGLLADIPFGWDLCDGSLGTPNLTEKFILGVPAGIDPGDTGGAADHDHDFIGDGHTHIIGAGSKMASGANFDDVVDSTAVTGTTDTESNLPPFFKLAFLKKA